MKKQIFIHATLAYCTACGKTEFARIVAEQEGVFMDRVCEKQGTQRTMVARDYQWYMERTKEPRQIRERAHAHQQKEGCPKDCGLCAWHSGALHLPVFSITNDCNLDCPKCFTYNRPDKKYYKSVEETAAIIDHIIKEAGTLQLINLTGGEPTLHPQLRHILEACRRPEIQRITMNTNGLKLAYDREMALLLKEMRVQPVLSLDTLNRQNSVTIYGRDIIDEKLKTLEILEELDIPTTLLSVCIKGVNEADITHIAETVFTKPFIRSMTIQNMTYTGKNGAQFSPREHITIDEVEALLCESRLFSQADFFPLSSYHPLCYSVAYYLSAADKLIALNSILPPELLAKLTENSYLIEADTRWSRDFMDGLNRLWAEGGDEETILALKKAIAPLISAESSLSEKERRNKAEKLVKMIYIHPHMDEDNFDIDRVSRCGDLVPDETGKMIPACSYNLLYRQKDARFWLD